MTPWLQDADVTLYHGDVLAILTELEAEFVDCVVTSPPYWGLRDYGTGEWEGGDAGCDHQGSERYYTEKSASSSSSEAFSEAGEANAARLKKARWREAGECVHCGATRIDQQLGLESTPEQYVERMVEVFREVRRVLAAHGTLWLNLGDSYGGDRGNTKPAPDNKHRVVHDASTSHRHREFDFRKQLIGIPWRVAFALQADGWYLRSDIIWSKPNPMPESVTDRPTKAHEYVFLLSKQPRYFFDQEAVREPHHYDGRSVTAVVGQNGSTQHRDGERWPNGGRNIRSVWEIATQPYPEAHFATFPEELARRCIAAGCPENGVVLDPFIGSGTVAYVARKLGRHAVGIDLSEEYLRLAARRLQQQSLFADFEATISP